MKVYDYWMCANKHLDFCEEILNSSVYKSNKESQELNNLIDIYYMLGYVFEGYTVCIAYSLEYELNDGENDKPIKWDMSKDVEDFDPIFSKASGLAYGNHNEIKKQVARCFLNKHDFNKIVETIVRKNKSCMAFRLDAPLPYFSTIENVDTDQGRLLEKWFSGFRYNYSDNILAKKKSKNIQDEDKEAKELKEKITEKNLRGLIRICRIFQKSFPLLFNSCKPKEN